MSPLNRRSQQLKHARAASHIATSFPRSAQDFQELATDIISDQMVCETLLYHGIPLILIQDVEEEEEREEDWDDLENDDFNNLE
jgi:hypothetical protein